VNSTNHSAPARFRRRGLDNTPIAKLPQDERVLRRLAGAIKEQRQLADISVFELARRTGLSSKSIASYERGDVWPSVRALVHIALALRITLQELLP